MAANYYFEKNITRELFIALNSTGFLPYSPACSAPVAEARVANTIYMGHHNIIYTLCVAWIVAATTPCVAGEELFTLAGHLDHVLGVRCRL